MRLGTLSRLLIPLFTLASLMACNIGAPSPTVVATQAPRQVTPTTAETPTFEVPPASGTGGACVNALYPVVTGSTWTYAGNGTPAVSYSYADTLTEVRPDGFTLTSDFGGGLARQQEWACKPEGLVALQLPGVAATLTTQQFQAEFETSNIHGVTLPASVSPGDQWTFGLTIKGTQTISGASGETTGDATYDFSAADMESVTVPAGTFDAMKIDGKLTLDLTASISGLSIPIRITLKTTSWFAPGVGMVKTVTTGDMPGTVINDTLELQSYNIP